MLPTIVKCVQKGCFPHKNISFEEDPSYGDLFLIHVRELLWIGKPTVVLKTMSLFKLDFLS